VGSFDGAAGKGSNCQIFSITTGGHRTLLAGTVLPERNLVPTSATSAFITIVEVIGKTLLQSRDLYITSRPRSLLHSTAAATCWSCQPTKPVVLGRPFLLLIPSKLVQENPGAERRDTRDKILETTTNGPSGAASFGFESISTSCQP